MSTEQTTTTHVKPLKTKRPRHMVVEIQLLAGTRV